jgi:hypothetical protein
MTVTGSEISLIITALATLVSSVGAAWSSLRNNRILKTTHAETLVQTTKLDAMQASVAAVEASTNGMKDQLVNEVRTAALAQGRSDAEDDARDEKS